MTRVNVPITTDDGELIRTGWFDDEKATHVPGRTEWDGNNQASIHVGPNRSQHLYRTPAGRYVLYTHSAYVTEADRYEFIEDNDAREWLIRNESDDRIEEWFGEVEEESGPPVVNKGGRPSVGDERIKITVDSDWLARVDAAADVAGISRAAWIRQAGEQALKG